MESSTSKLIVLLGHKIGEELLPKAIFSGYPNKEQLLQLDIFQDNEKDNQLLDILIKEHIVATAINNERYYEYQFMDLPDNGSLNFNDYLYTGYLDFKPEFWVHY